ncbi:hypothetical protein ACFE04_014078 [Oxalis oulophora]
MVLNSSGVSERFTWIDRTQSWLRYYSVIQDQCDNYAMCGANSLCDISKSPVCVCLDSFVPKSSRYWGLQDWSDGCVRKTPLSCDNDGGVGFLKITGIKLPDTSRSRVNKSIGLEECNKVCLKNCSCMAYANSDIRGAGSGCLLWFSDLLDIRTFPVGGQDLYVRLSASDLAHIETKNKWSRRKLIVVMTGSIVSFVALLAIGCIFFVQRKNLINQENDYSGKRKGSTRKATEEESAWKLWIEGRPLDLVDECLEDSCDLSEILRCIHVGLLCVQQKPEDRPNMSTAVLMLGSEGKLPEAMQPGFFSERNFPESESSTSKHESCSTNEITFTLVEPR